MTTVDVNELVAALLAQGVDVSFNAEAGQGVFIVLDGHEHSAATWIALRAQLREQDVVVAAASGDTWPSIGTIGHTDFGRDSLFNHPGWPDLRDTAAVTDRMLERTFLLRGACEPQVKQPKVNKPWFRKKERY